jgi:hypothetical protein
MIVSYNDRLFADGHAAGRQEHLTGVVPNTTGFSLTGADGARWWAGYNLGLSGKPLKL